MTINEFISKYTPTAAVCVISIGKSLGGGHPEDRFIQTIKVPWATQKAVRTSVNHPSNRFLIGEEPVCYHTFLEEVFCRYVSDKQQVGQDVEFPVLMSSNSPDFMEGDLLDTGLLANVTISICTLRPPSI